MKVDGASFQHEVVGRDDDGYEGEEEAGQSYY